MKRRCTNENCRSYQDYGGRGISYDPQWDDFEKFLKDMGEAPVGLTLERIENSGPYCKRNCRWATRAEQNNNKRNNLWLILNGETRSLQEWATIVDIPPSIIRQRLWQGWSTERSLSQPMRRSPIKH